MESAGGTGAVTDRGELRVVPATARSAVSEVIRFLGDRETAVAGAAPQVPVPAFGAGLAGKGAQVAGLFSSIHDNRLAHLGRIRSGVESAAVTVGDVERAEGTSVAALTGGAS
jgi:hypothetical protein